MKKVPIILLALFICTFSFSQPTQVKDIDTYCCLGGSNPSNLFVYNGLLYFTARDFAGTNSPGGANLGFELWVSDGTTDGTVFLKDLNVGEPNSSPNNFFLHNGNLYFSANSGSGNVLFTSDGTEGGTVATGASAVDIPVELDGLIYNINNSDKKLYAFNGTSNSPVTGSGNEYITEDQIIALDGKIFCYMSTSTEIGTLGTELYTYNPVSNAFQLIKDLTGDQLESALFDFTVLDNALYFTAFSESELWKTDGTEIGTVNISATSSISDFEDFFTWNGKLFFAGRGNDNTIQLWVYDPVGDTVTNISNLSGSSPNHNPSNYVGLDGWLYYSGEDGNGNDDYLWRTDGTVTYQLDNTIKDIRGIVAFNSKLYFRGDNGTDGNELFEFDPTTLGISEFSNSNKIAIYPNPSSDNITVKSTTSVKTIKMFNILGKLLLTTNQSSFSVSTFQKGLYLLKIETDKGQITKKIMVE